MVEIYGVDPEKDPLTPIMVRDAMVECFYKAHCADSDLLEDENDASADINRSYCQQIVRKAFADGGADFDQPTKDGLVKAIGGLKKFAANFRDPQIIKKHAGEIMSLVEKLPD